LFGYQIISKIDSHEINELINATKNNFKYVIKQYTPNEIDSVSKIVLLDRGYIELISKVISNVANSVIIIDDYGISRELRSYLNELEKNGHKMIVKYNADEEYTACKIASLVARYARINEVDNINKKYKLIDERTNCNIIPGAGSASNTQTKRYLIEYRKQNPYSNFPPFVRTKWRNVQQIEDEYPKRSDNFTLNCPYCKTNIRLLLIRYSQKNGSRIYCSNCDNLISTSFFGKYFSNTVIALDTSSILSRIVSKDLKTNGYFKGKRFLIPTFVFEEIDTKGPNLKAGGRNEITELTNKKNKEILLEVVDTYLLAHGL